MKRLTFLVTALLILATHVSPSNAAVKYFDVNDDAIGSGVADGQGYVWDTTTATGTGGWNANADGSGTGPGTTVAWVNGDDAVISAGTDATGLLYGFSIASGVTATNATIEEGTIKLVGGLLTTTGNLTINSGATLFHTGGTTASYGYNAAGKIVLNGGTLKDVRTGSAGTFIPTAKGIEVNGTGHIAFDNQDAINDSVVVIYSGTITGTGGTTSNGGAGTLIIDGPDQFGVASNANMTFAKLVVNGGSYRQRGGGGTVDQTFGATPTTLTPDAITLNNGGAIGSNASVTFNALRGLTIGSGSGRISGIGLGTITLLGPLTSAGGNTLQIDGRNLTTTSATFGRSGGGITLSNANNVTTFVNTAINIDSSTLTLNESLNAAQLSGGSQSVLTGGTATNKGAIATGTLTVVAGKTFTAGSDNSDSSYAGRVTGAGAFTKVGTGTLLLNTIAAEDISLTDVHTVVYSGEWSNTGGVNINAGSIKFGTSNSGFATTNPVTIGATGKLNMNGINDTFGSLAGPIGANVDMNDGGAAATPGNLNLGATTGATTYSGTITGGGNFTKSGASTQTLAGNASLGVVALNAGSTIVNSPATVTATGGVTVGASGILGGTGIIAGAVTNNGVIAPGDGGVGTLHVTGNVTDNAASSWSIDLSGATSDKLAVIGNIDLTAADTLNVAGAGTGSSWIIGTYTGTLTGAFDTVTSGYTVSYTGGNITLNAAAGVPGDFNGDGKVNAADYVSLRKQNSDITTGVGLTNYNTWRTNFGTGGPGSGSGLSSAAVPEPTSIVLLLSSLGFVAVGRRRTR